MSRGCAMSAQAAPRTRPRGRSVAGPAGRPGPERGLRVPGAGQGQAAPAPGPWAGPAHPPLSLQPGWSEAPGRPGRHRWSEPAQGLLPSPRTGCRPPGQKPEHPAPVEAGPRSRPGGEARVGVCRAGCTSEGSWAGWRGWACSSDRGRRGPRGGSPARREPRVEGAPRGGSCARGLRVLGAHLLCSSLMRTMRLRWPWEYCSMTSRTS